MTAIKLYLKEHWGAIVGAILSLALVSCAFIRPKAPSPLDPKRWVNGFQLEAEIAAFSAAAQASRAMIEQEKQIIGSIADMVMNAATAVPGPWGGLAAGIGGLLTIGLGVDRRRVIKQSERIIEAVNPAVTVAPQSVRAEIERVQGPELTAKVKIVKANKGLK